MSAERVDWITSDFARLAWPKSDHYFDKCFCAQVRGEMIVLVARTGERLHGYLKVVWKPDYRPFRDQSIPEIQDLNVVPVSRRNGIATRLMDAAERIVADRSAIVGIGVGLHPGYAAAQRMYALREYVPDAMPLTYKNQFVSEGQSVTLDDELVLHLTRKIETESAGRRLVDVVANRAESSS